MFICLLRSNNALKVIPFAKVDLWSHLDRALTNRSSPVFLLSFYRASPPLLQLAPSLLPSPMAPPLPSLLPSPLAPLQASPLPLRSKAVLFLRSFGKLLPKRKEPQPPSSKPPTRKTMPRLHTMNIIDILEKEPRLWRCLLKFIIFFYIYPFFRILCLDILYFVSSIRLNLGRIARNSLLINDKKSATGGTVTEAQLPFQPNYY